MPTFTSGWGACSRVLVAYRDNMLIIVSIMGAVQMTIVKVIRMAFMLDSNMAAILAVHMYMRVWIVYSMDHSCPSFPFTKMQYYLYVDYIFHTNSNHADP
jgi:hypothetical protein